MATKKKAAKKTIAKKATKKATTAARRPAPKPVARRARAATPAETAAATALLHRQSEALDAKAWETFIDCFAADGVYWAPTDPAHDHWDGKPSIFTEDRDLMTVRMKRIRHPNAWSQQAEWATSHVIGNVVVERVDANGDLHLRSRFHMMELRRDDVRHFAGSYRHHLAKTRDGYAIKLQRVDLINAQTPFEYVLQAWV